MKTLNITPWNLGDFSYWKRYFQKDTLQPHWKGLYQVQLTNSCATILQGIDSWIHISHLRKQQALTGLTHYLATWKKDFQEFKQTASNRQLSQDDQTRFAYLFLAVISSLSFLVQSTEKGENLSDCWSCCQNVSLFMMSEIPWSLLWPQMLTLKPMDVTYQIRLIWRGILICCYTFANHYLTVHGPLTSLAGCLQVWLLLFCYYKN